MKEVQLWLLVTAGPWAGTCSHCLQRSDLLFPAPYVLLAWLLEPAPWTVASLHVLQMLLAQLSVRSRPAKAAGNDTFPRRAASVSARGHWIITAPAIPLHMELTGAG